MKYFETGNYSQAIVYLVLVRFPLMNLPRFGIETSKAQIYFKYLLLAGSMSATSAYSDTMPLVMAKDFLMYIL